LIVLTIRIVYADDHLYYAYFDGIQWWYEVVDNAYEAGVDASIAIDSNNKAHISYGDYYYTNTMRLKYATNASGSWVTQTVDSPAIGPDLLGLGSSMAVDSKNKVHISYYDDSDLKYATNASGSWVPQTVDDNSWYVGKTSIALDSNDEVHISYNGRIYGTDGYIDGILKYATNAYVNVCFPDGDCSPDSVVRVQFPPDTVQQPEVNVTTTSNNPGGNIWGFHVVGSGGTSLYYDISASPPSTGPTKVCINYDDTGLTASQEASLRIKHWDGSGWSDETCPAPPANPDTVSNKICACVDHLSWFAVGYEVPADVVILPIGNEVLPSGATYGICWQAPQSAVKFDLLYTTNGTSWIPVKTVEDLNCTNWELPIVTANKKNCYVKVIAYDSADTKIGEGISEKFTIEVARIKSPNGGEVLRAGSTWNIKWEDFETIRPVAKTKLLYITNGGNTWNLIKTFKGDPGSTGASYSWTVPNVSSTKCKVKVVLKDAAGVNVGKDVSDKKFTIQP
jgi:hypothetical protein